MSPRQRKWSDDNGTGRGPEPLPTPARLHAEALRALARRELTRQQLREKLVASGARAADVETVLDELAERGALDDRRAARVYATTAFRVRKRSRARIRLELQQRGIGRDVAREVVDEVCDADAERHRLEQAVIRALRGSRRDQRDDAARRLFAAFVRQGYEPDDVRHALARAGAEPDATDQD